MIEQREHKISAWQLLALLLLARIMHSMIYKSFDFTGGTPILLALFCATVVEAIAAIPMVLYFQKGGQDIAAELCGKRAWAVKILYSLYFLVIAGGTIALFTEFIELRFDNTLSPIMAVVILSAAAAYVACLGIESAARAGTVVFWLFVILFVSMTAVSEGSFDWLNLRPLGAGDGQKFWEYFLENLSSSWWLPMLAALGSHLRSGAAKTAYGYVLMKFLISGTLILLVTLVLWRYINVLGYPILALGAYAKSGFIQRFDAINMFVWAINCTLVGGVYIFICSRPSKKRHAAAVASAVIAAAVGVYFYKTGLELDATWLLWFKSIGIVLLGIALPAAALGKLLITRARKEYVR